MITPPITPQSEEQKLANSLGLSGSKLYFKREDLHPFGSHKGRSIPVMIDKKVAEGCRHFVISSSGNAALAAGLYIKKLNDERAESNKIMLEILVGKNINQVKFKRLEALKDENILISSQERPLQALFIKTQDPKIQGLRQSNDDTALTGYAELAKELKEIPKLAAVFIGTSSGTTAQALAQNLQGVEIHIIQTNACHPIAENFVQDIEDEEKSLADAIVDQTALRKDTLTGLVEKSGGNGWVASNEQITSAQELTKKYTDVEISTNSALSVAGLMQAIYTGKTWSGAVVCMICGN